jgi:hypothetical protein
VSRDSATVLRLPDCVVEKILELYGDEDGDESMVGFIAGDSVVDDAWACSAIWIVYYTVVSVIYTI